MARHTNELGNNKYFDIRFATVGAAFMGVVLFAVNYKYGVEAASVAAAKQAAYGFVAGGALMKLCENTATYFRNPKVAKTMAVLAPAALTITATYLLQSFKDDVTSPLISTIPTAILGPISFTVWGNRKRNQLERMLDGN